MAKNKKPIAIAFSDHHWANWKQFNSKEERLQAALAIFNKISHDAQKHGVPILFSGDMVDHPLYIENIVLDYMTQAFKHLGKLGLFGINGNHDFNKVSSFKNPINGYMHSLARAYQGIIHCVDFTSISLKDIKVHGIPYIHGDIDFIDALKAAIKQRDKNKPNILLIHRDLAGAEEPSGKVIPKNTEQDKSLKKLFKKFDLVLSGHIHKPQQIKKLGKNVHMLGATHQQRRSDGGCKMGYWIIYSDMSLEFIDAQGPEFMYHSEDEEPGDDYNFWIKTPSLKKVKEAEVKKQFSVNSDRELLVKRYMKAKGQKSKSKLKTALKYI